MSASTADSCAQVCDAMLTLTTRSLGNVVILGDHATMSP